MVDFYENRAQYAETARMYDEFFARLPEIKRFDDGGFAIRIHQTGVKNLPTHRVGARFGIFGDWLELVGYDSNPAQAGKTIRCRSDVACHRATPRVIQSHRAIA